MKEQIAQEAEGGAWYAASQPEVQERLQQGNAAFNKYVR